MTRTQFCNKWDVDRELAYYYAKKYDSVRDGRTINYVELSNILDKRIKDREYAQELMAEKRPKDLYFAFGPVTMGNRSRACKFLSHLYYTLESPNVREREHQVILKIIEKFGENK